MLRRYRLGRTIDRWGPGAWNTLHVVAHTYPQRPTDAQREDLAAFLRLFARHLPCPKCRDHFETYLDEHLTPDSLADRAAAVRLLHDAHNAVNVRCGKPVWSLEAHYRLYGPRSSTRDDGGIALAIGLVVVLCGVAWQCQRHRRKIFRPLW